jgi:hypothetical protein
MVAKQRVVGYSCQLTSANPQLPLPQHSSHPRKGTPMNSTSKTKRKVSHLLPMSAALVLVAGVAPAPALADPLPYGPDTCIQGLVWREARTGDTVYRLRDPGGPVADRHGERAPGLEQGPARRLRS